MSTNQQIKKRAKRELRHRRVRSVVSGSAQRPRLTVFRSATHIYAQIIDDQSGKTLAAATSNELKVGKGAVKAAKAAGKADAATQVGQLIAEKAKAKGIASVVFDRGGYAYHGRVKALAEAARTGGLQF